MIRFLPLVGFLGLCLILLIPQLQTSTPAPQQEGWPINQPVPRVLLPLLPKNALEPSKASMPLGFAQAGIAQQGGYVLNFFASWCAPCAAEAPQLEALVKQHGIIVVGVAWKDEPSKLATFFSKYGRPFSQVLLDVDGKAMTELGATGVPETYLVDGGGIIRKRYRRNLTAADVDEISAFLAALPAPAPVKP